MHAMPAATRSERRVSARRVSDSLMALFPSLRDHWHALWSAPAHVFALDEIPHSAFSLCMRGLDAALQGVTLAPALPAALRDAARRRQLSFIGGRLCAERALALHGASDDIVGQGSVGEPLWPGTLRGSITHTDTSAHAVVLDGEQCTGIGIDSELVGATSTEIVAVCCTAVERRIWFGSTQDQLRATLIFSAKEAFYKAVYPTVRSFVDFTDVEVVAWDTARGELSLQPVAGGPLIGILPHAQARYRLDLSAVPCVHTVVVLHSTSFTSCS
jgi:enterobactin synthetase component D